MTLLPDKITASLLAVESVLRQGIVEWLGSDNYHTYVADILIPKRCDIPRESLGRYLNGMYRIPCTYIDEPDYVFGSLSKNKEALASPLSGRTYRSPPPSPGTALIGDDIQGMIEKKGVQQQSHLHGGI